LQEDRRYLEQYEYTLNKYREVFGEEPPSDIWPDSAQRFAGRPIRVDRERCWLLPKPTWWQRIVCTLSQTSGPDRRQTAWAGAFLFSVFGGTRIAVAADYSLFGITLSEEIWTGLIFLGFFCFVFWIIYRTRPGKGPGGRGGPAGCGAGCGTGGCGA